MSSRTAGVWHVVFAVLCASLAAVSGRATFVLLGPVLAGDRGGDFVGGYFSGAARGLTVVAGAVFLASAFATYALAARARRLPARPRGGDLQ
jgi:hypothetical protein